ncbi:hypothetical protein HJD18_15285 [Thermoleophilia bacterium SCSIO 60948]|nr:hypothetical protein HJD18_15285 [Thermoleophilia bacterium SCSIO 60948]
MGALEITLIAAAVLIGMTGTWSPCGFSMIETIGPTGHTGGQPTTLAACATFLPGALAGGVATFWLIALLGGVIHGAGGSVALLLAAVLALVAAVLEARGTPIVPQIRRQLPEHWRRAMPMPVASALYGGLLGLGFTTFVLTFGVWALAGIAFAIGEPVVGLWVGLAFGLGRALPIVSLAPFAKHRFGQAACETMAMRPAIYRGFRFGDALALTGVAVLLISSASSASAQEPEESAELAAGQIAKPAADPSAGPDSELAYQLRDRDGVLETVDGKTALPGKDPAVGGSYVAVRRGKTIFLLARNRELEEVSRFTVKGNPDALTVTGDYIGWRAVSNGRDKIAVRSIKGDGTTGKTRVLDSSSKDGQLSRPSISGKRIVYAVAKPNRNSIVSRTIGKGGTRTIKKSDKIALQNPSVRGGTIAYVAITKKRQRLVVKKGKSSKQVASRGAGKGVIWSTSLGAKRAYYTLIKGTSYRVIATGY